MVKRGESKSSSMGSEFEVERRSGILVGSPVTLKGARFAQTVLVLQQRPSPHLRPHSRRLCFGSFYAASTSHRILSQLSHSRVGDINWRTDVNCEL